MERRQGCRHACTGTLALRLERVPTARGFEVHLSYGTNGWQQAGIYTQAPQNCD